VVDKERIEGLKKEFNQAFAILSKIVDKQYLSNEDKKKDNIDSIAMIGLSFYYQLIKGKADEFDIENMKLWISKIKEQGKRNDL
jgi:protein involved in sex pheromone biosynthesis